MGELPVKKSSNSLSENSFSKQETFGKNQKPKTLGKPVA